MEQRRKVTIILLIGLTLFLGVGSILVTQIIRTNQSPTDSAASGFGEEATKDLYDDVERIVKTGGCEALLSKDVMNLYTPQDFTLVRASSIEEAPLSYPEDQSASLNCAFKTSYGADIVIRVYTYDSSSQIDFNAQALYDRVNTNISENLMTGSVYNSMYFMGYDNDSLSKCRLNLFHSQNDFEYLTIELTNFGNETSCQYQTNLMGELAFITGYAMNNYMLQARAEAGLN